MVDMLRDSIWQFVGALIAVVALVVTVVVYLKQRRRKLLDFEVLSKTKLLTVDEELEGKISITYEGNAVKDIHLLVLKFINTGDVPISATDFERKLGIRFNESAKILSSVVTDNSPKNLNASIASDEKSVNVDPLLLNQKDFFVVKFLIEDFDGKINVDGRVNGVKDIRKISEDSGANFLMMLFSLVLILAGMYYFVSETPVSVPDKFPPSAKVGLVMLISGYMLSFFLMMKRKSFRRSLMRFFPFRTR